MSDPEAGSKRISRTAPKLSGEPVLPDVEPMAPVPAPTPAAPAIEEPPLVQPAFDPVLHIKLDRKRPFGTCHGHEDGVEIQARFYQDGLYFSAAGDVIPGRGSFQKKLEHQNRPRRSVTMTVEVDENGQPIFPDRAKEAADAAELAIRQKGEQIRQSTGEPDVDLFKWARGEEFHPWFQIRGQIMRVYAQDIRSAHEARDFLLDGKWLKKAG